MCIGDDDVSADDVGDFLEDGVASLAVEFDVGGGVAGDGAGARAAIASVLCSMMLHNGSRLASRSRSPGWHDLAQSAACGSSLDMRCADCGPAL
jgi:hypothetical protein